jgi:hypothetical protein
MSYRVVSRFYTIVCRVVLCRVDFSTNQTRYELNIDPKPCHAVLDKPYRAISDRIILSHNRYEFITLLEHTTHI